MFTKKWMIRISMIYFCFVVCLASWVVFQPKKQDLFLVGSFFALYLLYLIYIGIFALKNRKKN